jgi:hypothetical protein
MLAQTLFQSILADTEEGFGRFIWMRLVEAQAVPVKFTLPPSDFCHKGFINIHIFLSLITLPSAACAPVIDF